MFIVLRLLSVVKILHFVVGIVAIYAVLLPADPSLAPPLSALLMPISFGLFSRSLCEPVSVNCMQCGISFMMTSYISEQARERRRAKERTQVICGQKLWSFD